MAKAEQDARFTHHKTQHRNLNCSVTFRGIQGFQGRVGGRGWVGGHRQVLAALRAPRRDGAGRRRDQHAGDGGVRAAAGLDAKRHPEVNVNHGYTASIEV